MQAGLQASPMEAIPQLKFPIPRWFYICVKLTETQPAPQLTLSRPLEKDMQRKSALLSRALPPENLPQRLYSSTPFSFPWSSFVLFCFFLNL